MNNFFTQAYLKPKYFNQAYLHGATAVQDAKSGYWRLFYYNMQEEALKADEQKQRETTEKRESERKTEEPVQSAPAKVTAPVVRRSVQAKPVEEKPTTRERPIYATAPELPLVTPLLNIISMEFRMMLQTSQPLYFAMLERKAANDEDEEDVELLLLVA